MKQARTTVTALANPVFTDAEDGPGDQESRRDVVVIDSLFVMDQFRAAERVSVGRPHARDIADVTAVAEAVLPKGSARISTAVRRSAFWGAGAGPGPTGTRCQEKQILAILFLLCRPLLWLSRRLVVCLDVTLERKLYWFSREVLTGLPVTAGEGELPVATVRRAQRLPEGRSGLAGQALPEASQRHLGGRGWPGQNSAGHRFLCTPGL